MNWKLLKKKFSDFLEEGRQFTIVVIDRKKLLPALGIMVCAILLIVHFQDGVDLWKKAILSSSEIENEDKLAQGTTATPDEDTQIEDKPDEAEEAEDVIVDISDSHDCRSLETELQKINEPVVFDGNLIYSGGTDGSIKEQAVLTKLFIYDIAKKKEQLLTESQIKFGELYEGRLSKRWIVWLDTNHIGHNIIYGMDRATDEIFEIRRCKYNRPQLRLWDDNLIWIEQSDLDSDTLYLYNFSEGEPIALETFNNATYGTCPPSIYENILIWSAPDGEGRSVIKRLDLEDIKRASEQDVEPEILDPEGFAIYPSTNGKAIAWLDTLDPKKATLKFTLDGDEIIDVAEGVGRFFGIGDQFIAYTKNDNIMVYFWKDESYARINPKDTKGRLSQCSVSGKYIVWYSNAPNDSQDIVNISMLD